MHHSWTDRFFAAGKTFMDDFRRSRHDQVQTPFVLRLRFGLGEEEPLTLEEIGNLLGLTRERVHQIEKTSLAELAASLPSI
jgi:hypothetical protein